MGVSPADFLGVGVPVFFAAPAWVSRPGLEPWAERLAKRVGWSMLVLAILPIALRLALLPHHPVPYPENLDEHGHLLVADTLRYFRLSNPAHPMQRLGGRSLERRRVLFPDVLDAAGMGASGVGAAGRPAGGDRVRSAMRVDQY